MKEIVLIKKVTNTSKRRIFIKNKNHFQNDDDDLFEGTFMKIDFENDGRTF